MSNLIPPWTADTAYKKVKFIQNMCNMKDPNVVQKGCTEDSIWRIRDVVLKGHDEINNFARKKWENQYENIVKKEVFAFTDDKIAVQFWYEYHDKNNQWWRCYGLEYLKFEKNGMVKKCQMNSSEIKINNDERWFKNGINIDNIEIDDKI